MMKNRKAIELGHATAEAWQLRGLIESKLGASAECVRALEEAERLDPASALDHRDILDQARAKVAAPKR